MPAAADAPMFSDWTMEFPYKHSTGEIIGRFLAGLRDQRRIWGQRVPGQGVIVPPLGYGETDAADGGEWVAVANTGTVAAVAVVHEAVEGLHPAAAPFAFVLVRLDGADTALPHVVTEGVDRVRVGSRVEAVWRPDGERVGSIRDIAGFRPVD
ncbi:MAG TPA: OB-fold domain-containing protein [Candidatus Binatia bacterium]|nr:OB-fold domain-containing protein [Candidatus Binatia bacterium]